MQQTVKAFQLGSSTVVTLPKELGIKPGQRLKIKKLKGHVVLQKSILNREEEIRRLVKKLSGGLRLSKHLTPKEINEELDRRYEEMLPRR